MSIGIFAIMAAIAYGGLVRVLEQKEILEAVRQSQRGLLLAMMRLEQDLLQVRNRPVRNIGDVPQPGFRGEPTDTRALGNPSIEFTRGGVPVIIVDKQSKGLDLQRVAYRLNEEGELIRLSWPVLDQAPTTEAESQVLLQGVTDFQARFFTRNKKWSSHWPPVTGQSSFASGAAPQGTAAALPAGVEITLELEHLGTITRIFRLGAHEPS